MESYIPVESHIPWGVLYFGRVLCLPLEYLSLGEFLENLIISMTPGSARLYRTLSMLKVEDINCPRKKSKL